MALQPNKINKPLQPVSDKVAPNEKAQKIEQEEEEIIPEVVKEPTLAELNAFQRKLNRRLNSANT